MSKKVWRFRHILVAFSKYMKFNSSQFFAVSQRACKNKRHKMSSKPNEVVFSIFANLRIQEILCDVSKSLKFK